MKVVTWVHGFDPQNINDFDLRMPEDLKQINEYTKSLLRDYPRQAYLSPSNSKGSLLGRLKQRNASAQHDELDFNSLPSIGSLASLNQLTQDDLINQIKMKHNSSRININRSMVTPTQKLTNFLQATIPMHGPESN
jgi:hypothetical protein